VSNVDPTPLFAFGHGLSYAPATWVSIEAGSSLEWQTDGVARVSVTLRNTTDRPTAEVVQVYLHDPVAEVSRPVQQLIAAQRVELDVGATRTVVFEMHADLTSYTGRAGHRQVEPGAVELQLGASSADIRRSLQFELVGPTRQVGHDRALWPTIEVTP
jgi:beta-glucosidase